jgi:PAS domain S-box-containing protein
MIEMSARAASLERKALAFEHASQPMAILDAATQTILECNRAFADGLGYATDELPGLALSSLFGPRVAGGAQAMLPEAQLQGVLDTVPVGLAIAEDAGARHIRGNSFIEHMLGLPRGAELSKTSEPERGYRVVRDGRPVPAEELPVQRACRGERVEGEQLEVLCENGRRLFLLANAAPLYDEAGAIRGAIRGAVGAFLDVTRRVAAESRLAEQHLRLEEQVALRTRELEHALAESARNRERFELAMRGANDGLWDWDMLTGEVYYSPRWKAMLGYGEDELEPCFHTWARLVDDDGRQRVLERVEEIKAGRTDHFDIEFRMRHKQGHDVYVRSRAFVARNPEAQPVRMVGTVRDITEQKRREKALRESELKFSKAFHDNPLGMSISRMEDGRFLDVNESLATIFGLQRNEMIGRTSLELGMWDDPAQRRQVIATVKRTGRAHNVEAAFHRRNDPTQRTVLISFDILELGGEACLLGTSLEITERKALEQALRRESHKNEALLRNASDGIFLMDRNARLVGVSDSTCAMLGYRREELNGMHLAQWDAEYDEALLAFFHRCLANPARIQFERRHRRKGGGILDVEISAVPVTIDGESLLFCSSRDISQRKRAEEALMRKTRELRALLDTIPAPVFFKDQDMRHVEVNQAFCEFVGLPAECIIGCRNQDLFSEDVAASYDAGDQAVLREGRVVLGEELEIADARGRKGWYAIFKSPLYEDDGRIVGLVGLRVDITQRKQGEAERIALLERQRDTLIREVYHRIKNHLQGVIGLLRGHVTRNPETLAFIEMVVNQVRAISQVYGLQSRTEGGVLALRRFLEDMVTQRPTGLPVELSVAEGLADANLSRESLVPLALVINELLTNAEKHLLPSGPPCVQARLEPRPGGVALRITGSPARLPDDFDFLEGRGVGAGLDLVHSLLPDGVTLSFREEEGGVVAELVLTASALMPLKHEA